MGRTGLTVGIGTKQGQKFNVSRLVDAGKTGRRNNETDADKTGGEYFNAINDEDRSRIYEKLNTQIGFEKKNVKVTALVVALAVVCALVGGGLSMLWFGCIF